MTPRKVTRISCNFKEPEAELTFLLLSQKTLVYGIRNLIKSRQNKKLPTKTFNKCPWYALICIHNNNPQKGEK